MMREAHAELISGNRMVAQGALDAGCRFFSGYPITPSSEIYETMMKELPGRNGLAMASPDEITALAQCVGASMCGGKAIIAHDARIPSGPNRHSGDVISLGGRLRHNPIAKQQLECLIFLRPIVPARVPEPTQGDN